MDVTGTQETINTDLDKELNKEMDTEKKAQLESAADLAGVKVEAPVVSSTDAVEAQPIAVEAAPMAEETVVVESTEPSQEVDLSQVDNILDLEEVQYPQFTLAKNKARFLRMLTWYRSKREWLDVAPMSGVAKLFKNQTKELEGIRANKLDYEMELETGTLTPSQRSYKKDELKMCKVQEKMAVQLITKMQIKIKSGRR